VIDLTENLLSISQLCKKLPPGRGGAKCSPSTIWRWIVAGITAADGKTVKLRAVRLGGRFLIPETALAEFIKAQNAPGVTVATTGSRKSAKRAAKELDAIGI